MEEWIKEVTEKSIQQVIDYVKTESEFSGLCGTLWEMYDGKKIITGLEHRILTDEFRTKAEKLGVYSFGNHWFGAIHHFASEEEREKAKKPRLKFLQSIINDLKQ